MHVLFAAAENGALPGAKVGCLADVVEGLPPALTRAGCAVGVVIPSYGFLHRREASAAMGEFPVRFYGGDHNALLYAVRPPATRGGAGVRHYVIEHPALAAPPDRAGPNGIYCTDPPEAPFATDATRFAFFGAALVAGLRRRLFGPVDVLHLHDWHAAFPLILRHRDPASRFLSDVRCVFSIHNLALQGIRPFDGHASSLAAWYPFLPLPCAEIADPRWPNCVNPMAAGIRLADAVHAVSPSYAREILRPSDPPRFFGGEGLERDLQAAHAQGRLVGILNGCGYPPQDRTEALGFGELCRLLRETVIGWAAAEPGMRPAHFVAHSRLTELGAGPVRPAAVLTAVSRAVPQKLYLMQARTPKGVPALHALLDGLGRRGVLLLLGAGDPGGERFLLETSSRFPNFIFLNGFSEKAARALYASGDLFIMPSSYEPCGISQMLAMRAGQPCVVHRIGGLRDTVTHAVNGFCFEGETVAEQAENFVSACLNAVGLLQAEPARWEEIRRRAAAARFSWEDAAAAVLSRLYRA